MPLTPSGVLLRALLPLMLMVGLALLALLCTELYALIEPAPISTATSLPCSSFCCCCCSRLSWAAALYDWLRVTDDRVLVILKTKDIKPLADCRTEAAARSFASFIIVSYDMLKDTEEVLAALRCQVGVWVCVP
jgi:hypothetical protein